MAENFYQGKLMFFKELFFFLIMCKVVLKMVSLCMRHDGSGIRSHSYVVYINLS